MNGTRFLLTVFALVMIPSIAAAKPERRMALMIGNSLYPAAALTGSTDNADTITKALKKCNFTVTKALNLDKEHMAHVLAEFQQALTETRGIGFFYFAGNGFQADGENYLIPIDADPKSKADAVARSIPLSSVMEAMKTAGGRINIIALEAANPDPFGADFRPAKAGFAAMTAPKGFFLMTSALPDTVVRATPEQSSLFTARLAELLTTPETALKDGFEALREDILKATGDKQAPWLSADVVEPVYLYDPKRDFFHLLADVREFMRSS